MTFRVEVSPSVLGWARARSGIPDDEWDAKFGRFEAWITGEVQPTLKQLEDFGRRVHAPIGFLLLNEPPHEDVPIPDFRTIGDVEIHRPTADLLDTVYACQQRQEWYRDNARLTREEPVGYVGAADLRMAPGDVAEQLREALDWTEERRSTIYTWTDALAALRGSAEELGVLVMISGIVGSDTHRKLNPEEFRGFALVDPLAPVVFVNGGDTKAAQIFTFAHEMAHVWLGATGLSDLAQSSVTEIPVERWCNAVAAELLVPILEFVEEFAPDADLSGELERLARRFKVSTLVILGRVREAGHLSWDQYRAARETELSRVLAATPAASSSGGNFYSTLLVHVSRRFAEAVVISTLEGQTLYRDAFQMLGLRKQETFDKLVETLGAG